MGTQSFPRTQGGFIITVELLLIVTILVIGSVVGLIAIRDALVKRMAAQESSTLVVVDASGAPLGEFVGFDEHEAPLLFYVDRSVPPLAPDPAHRDYRALIGIRDDRFSGREPVYYSGPNCSGTPCLKVASDEITDSSGLDGTASTGAVSYLYGLQGGPTYAIGASADGIQGLLLRSETAACPVEAADIRSRYMSQRVVTGSPCEDYALGQPGAADTTCLADLGGVCSCPIGTTDQGDVLSNYLGPIDTLLSETTAALNAVLLGLATLPSVDVGEVCCPTGTRLRDDGNLVNSTVYVLLRTVIDQLDITDSLVGGLVDSILQPLNGTLYCESSAQLLAAEEVLDPNDPNRNALSRFLPPFGVNLPTRGNSGAD
ncbi:MAG: hypothetical protein ACPHCJ_07995, partial [Oceanococcaceae bacterium]